MLLRINSLKTHGGEKIINYSSRGVSTAAVGITVAIVVGIVVGAGVYTLKPAPKRAPIIRILSGNWPVARPAAHILALTYNKMGYETAVMETTIAIAYKTLVENGADLYPGEWWPSYTWVYDSVPKAKELPVLGVNRSTYDEGIAVPRYVYDNMKADLGRPPRLADLPKYGKNFNYTIYAPAPGWTCTKWTENLTDIWLDGDWETFVAGSAIAQNAKMLAAIRNKEWCALGYWNPTILWAKADIVYLENPTPESGKYRFGVVGKGQIRTRSRIGLSEDFPDEVVGLAKAFRFPKREEGKSAREITALWVSKEGLTVKEAARRWMDEHPDIVEGWIENARG